MEQRGKNGQFLEGNGGGPGRPPRKTEWSYLRSTTSACSLEDWQQIVARAVADAKNGNAKAREFLARYLLGDGPVLSELAALDEVGLDPVDEKRQSVEMRKMLAR